MTLNALILVLGLIGLLCLISAVRNFRRRRLSSGMVFGTAAVVLFAVAGFAWVLSTGLRTYSRLTAEQNAGDLLFKEIGYHQFNGTFTTVSGERTDFALRGDGWQIDARFLKWRAFANLLGFDAAYRLERISGRYTRIEDERTQPRTVYSLSAPEEFDPWQLLQRHQRWLPWADALYGSATYLPMADGAHYEIKVSPSGLLARPLNPAARQAISGWH